VAAVSVWMLPGEHENLGLALVMAAFFASKALNAHYAERARAQSAFLAYTALQLSGPVGGLALGWLAMHHWGATAAVLLGAYAVAQTLGTLLAFPGLGMSWRLPRPDAALLKAALGFGGPLLGLAMLSWVAENYIRYLVQWQAGAAALGLMIVGWALGRRCASVAAMVVTTAAFPIASRLLNEGRREEALAQLRLNAVMLMFVLLPVTVAVELLGPALVAMTVATEYRDVTVDLLGLSMAAGAIRNLHVHVTNQLMVLERRLKRSAQIDLVEIVACIVASAIGLLLYDLRGAVIGQALGSLLTLWLSIVWARRDLGFHWPWQETVKLGAACALMGAVLWWLRPSADLGGLLLGSAVGTVVFLLAAALVFAPELRRWRAARAAV
jgi:O-antigen/teichoic acid export membrane protein